MSHLPPGPMNLLAPIGLTYQHYIRLRINPMSFAVNLARKYGDITFFRFFQHPAVLINHPDLIREVLITQAENFPKYDRIRDHLRQATGDGLLVTNGELWREQRVSVQKVIRSNRMNIFGELTTNYTLDMLDRWDHRESIPIEEEMTLLMQAIMGKGLFGVELKPGHHIAEAVRIYSDIFYRESRALFNLPDWFPIKLKAEKRRSIKILRESLAEIVSQRIQSETRREDLLDMLLYPSGPHDPGPMEKSKDSIVEAAMNQLLTMYVAGFHTTSVALAWLFYCVARYPGVQQQLRDEISNVCHEHNLVWERLPELTYVDQVIKESLRLYPAAWELFARRSLAETELGGYHIPAGTLTLITPIVTHRDPRFFPHPDEFDPTRFAPDRESEIPPFAYLPFGLGAHNCIGKSLALMQMKLLLVHVLQRFELCLKRPDRVIRMVPRVSARPQGDIEINLKPRNQQRFINKLKVRSLTS